MGIEEARDYIDLKREMAQLLLRNSDAEGRQAGEQFVMSHPLIFDLYAKKVA